MSTLQFAKGISRLGTESAFTVLARAQQLAASGQDIINLGIGQPDFRTPEHIVQAGIKALQDAGSPTSKTLFFNLLPRLKQIVSSSSCLPITGSIFPCETLAFRFVVNAFKAL